jgi:hypothetical protein
MATALQVTRFLPATDPYGTSVHADVFPDNTVDWIVLEFRTAPMEPAVFRQAALLRNDGIIIDTSGQLPVFDESLLPPGSYYIVLRHRNHLAVMSARPIALSATTPLYDFTTGNEKIYVPSGSPYGGLIQLSPSVWAIPTGDVDSNGIITMLDMAKTKAASGNIGYVTADLSLDGVINGVDRVLARNNVYRFSSVPNLVPPEHKNSPLRVLSLAPVPAFAGEPCRVEFSLDWPTAVRITIVDINGRSVIVQEGWLGTGCHAVELPGHKLATGVYYLNLTADKYTETRRLPVVQ